MGRVVHKELSYAIVGAAMEVHKVLGAGFLESVYQAALAEELAARQIAFEQEKRLAVCYKGTAVGDFVADFLVEGRVILELKAVTEIHSRHLAQTRNYLRATGLQLGIVLNFGAPSLQHKRVVN